jgi:hypothetical protein
MNKIQTFLQGKKSYVVGITGAAYCVGAYFHLWPLDDNVLKALGCTGFVTMAAKFERLLSPSMTTDSSPVVQPNLPNVNIPKEQIKA